MRLKLLKQARVTISSVRIKLFLRFFMSVRIAVSMTAGSHIDLHVKTVSRRTIYTSFLKTYTEISKYYPFTKQKKNTIL